MVEAFQVALALLPHENKNYSKYVESDPELDDQISDLRN